MKIQDYIADSSREAAMLAFRYAEAVPQDKLEWSPLDKGQSVIKMCRELALTPLWAVFGLSDPEPAWDPEKQAEQQKVIESWTTVEQCKAEFEKNFPQWEAVARGMPDEKLSKSKFLSITNREHTFLDLLDYVRWNSSYHLGQIAYIQTLYGDKEMYW